MVKALDLSKAINDISSVCMLPVVIKSLGFISTLFGLKSEFFLCLGTQMSFAGANIWSKYRSLKFDSVVKTFNSKISVCLLRECKKKKVTKQLT